MVAGKLKIVAAALSVAYVSFSHGANLETETLQAQIDAASRSGGGRVVVTEGRHLTVIRRKGDSFYIGAMTGDAAHETEIALDFLEAGCDHEAEILADDLSDAGAPRGYRSERRIVRKGDRLNVKMSAAGGFCAVVRMKQELAVHGDGEACPTSENECVHVRKSAPVLGYQLDVSRCKVPTMEALYRIVDIVAKLDYNHFELYTEHTFAYKGHEAVWCEASPMTPDGMLTGVRLGEVMAVAMDANLNKEIWPVIVA